MDGTSLLTPRARERYVLVGDRETFTPDAEALITARAKALGQRLLLFGAGSRGPGLYGLGPNRVLLAREVEALEVTDAGGVSAEIDQERELRAVDLTGEYVPARLTGLIEGDDDDAPRDLAVSVEGRIVAVARTYVSAGEERISVLIPDSALRNGANDVELYWVTSGPVLHELWPGP
jgi:hypothetical protein